MVAPTRHDTGADRVVYRAEAGPVRAVAVGPTSVPADQEAVDAVEAKVVLPAHLHARPAGALVQVAARFSSTVEIQYGERRANARGVLGLMSLGALAGSTVVIRAHGSDAQAAVTAVADVLASAV